MQVQADPHLLILSAFHLCHDLGREGENREGMEKGGEKKKARGGRAEIR
jgi:hypothetical protein